MGGYGLLIIILGPIAIRLSYELMMMAILLLKNVIAINRNELLQKLFWCARPFLLSAARANG